jgi:hypothetical protein
MKKLQNIYVGFILAVSVLFCAFQGLCVLSIMTQDPEPLLKRKTIIFRIDDSFTYEEQEIIAKGLRQWETASNNYFQFKYYTETITVKDMFRWKEDTLPTIYNASSIVSWKRHVAKSIMQDTSIVGFAMIYPGDIFVFSTSTEDNFLEKLITHEVGHLLMGPIHSSNENSIMQGALYPKVQLSIQSEDLEIAKAFCGLFFK